MLLLNRCMATPDAGRVVTLLYSVPGEQLVTAVGEFQQIGLP